MNELQVIYNQEVLGKEFNIYGTYDEPLFLAKDVANWIEHTDLSRMVNLVDEEEKLKRTLYVSGQNREMWFLTEDGLYEVLMQSRKPIAKQFKKEVKQILKTIRQTGGYIPINEDEDDATIMAKALLIAQKTIEKKDKLITELQPKANWFDEFINSEGCYTSTQVAKVLHISSARKLNQILHDKGIIYKQGKNWLPYTTTNNTWYKMVIGNANEHSYSQLKFTPKGIYGISKILDIEIKEEDIELA